MLEYVFFTMLVGGSFALGITVGISTGRKKERLFQLEQLLREVESRDSLYSRRGNDDDTIVGAGMLVPYKEGNS